MSTFGCHSCRINFEDYKDKPYEQWPCATCQMANDYSKTFNTGYFDTAALDELEDENQRNVFDEHEFVTSGDFPLTPDDLHSLETIVSAVVSHVSAVFSGLLVKLLKLGKEDPIMFEILIKKMQFPHMSYAMIGDSMSPKVTKQNVLYHMKSLIRELPELEKVLPTDTRYSAGHYALITLAERRKKELAEERLQRNIFGEHFDTFRIQDIDELNKILHAPFNIRDEVFNFNAYLDDETYLNEHINTKHS